MFSLTGVEEVLCHGESASINLLELKLEGLFMFRFPHASVLGKEIKLSLQKKRSGPDANPF